MARIDVLAVGELNPDLILAGIEADQPRIGTEQAFAGMRLTLGSSTAIACVVMRRLGLSTAMAAWVGDDNHGQFCRAALAAEGIDTALVRTHPTVATGVTVCLPYPSDRLLLTARGTMALDPSDAIDAATLAGARHVHVGSFFLQTALRAALPTLFARARVAGLTTSLDTGWDPAERWLDDDLRASLAQTSVFLPNAAEFDALTGGATIADGIARLLALGVGAVALKRGRAGAVHGDRDGLVDHSGFAAAAIDTTGAGDAFNAGYLAAMLRGAAPIDRLAQGNACGALTVAAVGGTGGVVDIAQVGAFTATHRSAAMPPA